MYIFAHSQELAALIYNKMKISEQKDWALRERG
jgi:hypothetical protein